MDALIYGLTAQRIAERRRKRRNLKLTVLHRPGGSWDQHEVGRLINGLMTEVSRQQSHPEHLVLLGHFTNEQTLRASGGLGYTVTQVTGVGNAPFPCFV